MTAIRDALTRAGINTAGIELKKMATEALRSNGGSVEQATVKMTRSMRKRDDLLAALVRDFLQRVAAETPVAAREKKVDVREHKRQRPRTAAERSGALVAAGTAVQALRSIFEQRIIDGRPIGDLRWGELRAMVHANASSAASYLRLGTEATENAILLDKIEAFAQVEDHSTKIRQVLTAQDLERLDAEAQREAPRLVEMGMRYYTTTVEQRRSREIAQ